MHNMSGIAEGKVCKGGQNPPNTSNKRPPAPRAGSNNADAMMASVVEAIDNVTFSKSITRKQAAQLLRDIIGDCAARLEIVSAGEDGR